MAALLPLLAGRRHEVHLDAYDEAAVRRLLELEAAGGRVDGLDGAHRVGERLVQQERHLLEPGGERGALRHGAQVHAPAGRRAGLVLGVLELGVGELPGLAADDELAGYALALWDFAWWLVLRS